MAVTLNERILEYLSNNDNVTTLELSAVLNTGHQKVIGVMKSLESLGDIIRTEQKSRVQLEITPEGEKILENGSHEALVFAKVPPKEGIQLKKLLEDCGNDENTVKIGFNKAVQAGWVKVVTEGGNSVVVRNVDTINDETQANLKKVAGNPDSLNENVVNDLKKRKLALNSTVNYFEIVRGPNFSTSVVKQDAELTADVLANKEYLKRTFKPYNFAALGSSITGGHLHPLLKVRAEFLTILTEMGFSEMPTNRFVESSFWNFDTLFVPQKHPARDVQDTFFMARPQLCRTIPQDYMDKIKRVHSVGAYGSKGYGTDWKQEEAMKNVLRTHTTAISARVLYELAQNKPFKAVKKFSIDRVFRNESLDATHLAEFHQVEGFVADKNLSLGHLIGVMTEFFRRLGIEQLRFKPAFNPYTEPSMEVFAFHPGLKKWVEVGNSGVFRPEMLLPMGLPEDVRVIAWGLSLERPTMIRYGIDNIRTLVGPRVDLKMVYNNPICRLDKQ